MTTDRTTTEAPVPELTLYLRSFAASDPGDWRATFAQAEAADAAGIDRLRWFARCGVMFAGGAGSCRPRRVSLTSGLESASTAGAAP